MYRDVPSKEERIAQTQRQVDKALSDNHIFHKGHDSNKTKSTYFFADPDNHRFSNDEIDIRISDHSLGPQNKKPDLDITIPGVGRQGAVRPSEAIEMIDDLEKGEETIRRNELTAIFESILREMTTDQLQQNSVTSNLTQKHLDKRYTDGNSDIYLSNATWYTKDDFVELNLIAKATFVGGKGYVLTIRFYNVNQLLNKNGDYQQLPHSAQEKLIKDVFHTTDIRVHSNDPSFQWQGEWENLSKHDLTIYKYSGPRGKDIWKDRHEASGGLANSEIYFTKHLSQFVSDVDAYVRKTVQMLKIK